MLTFIFVIFSQAVVLEGKYWKRRLDTVTKEYKKWRRFYRDRILQTVPDTPSFFSPYREVGSVIDVCGLYCVKSTECYVTLISSSTLYLFLCWGLSLQQQQQQQQQQQSTNDEEYIYFFIIKTFQFVTVRPGPFEFSAREKLIA